MKQQEKAKKIEEVFIRLHEFYPDLKNQFDRISEPESIEVAWEIYF